MPVAGVDVLFKGITLPVTIVALYVYLPPSVPISAEISKFVHIQPSITTLLPLDSDKFKQNYIYKKDTLQRYLFERKDYPIPNKEGEFYKAILDVKNAKTYDKLDFISACKDMGIVQETVSNKESKPNGK